MPALDPTHLWLLVGAICLALEAFGIPGLGFLFAGLAGIVVAVLIHYQIIDEANYVAQLAAFFGLTGLLAAILWKKLKSWRMGSGKHSDYSNIIGDMATIGRDGLFKGRVGQVSWSGTSMMAELADDAPVDGCLEGDMVKIVDVKGNKLIVTPA